MTQEELLEAFKSDRRTPVDVNFGQIPLSPTIGRAGNYNVVQRGVVKDNAASELSRALAQLPQIAGQFKNIQEKAGAMDVQSLDNDEIVRRVESGDTEATGFLKDWGKQRGYSRALYDQYYKTTKVPEIEALTSKIADMTPEELSGFLTNGGQMSAMDDDQMQAALEQQYRDALTPDDTIKLDDHMKVLYNESLRQAPLLAAKSLGTVRKKQRDYIDQETTRSLGEALSDMPTDSFVPPHDSTASTDVTGLPTTDQPTNAPAARSAVPLVRGKVTVYSPQKGGDKMEGGYPSAKKGPDGKFLVRTVADVVSGSSDYVTLAGSPQFYGRSYIIPSLPYLDPKTGKVTILENVKGVVHDTGSAFKTAPEGRFDIPLGKDLDNKTMNNYNGLLNNSNVRFVREVNQDGDPEDYKDPNEKSSEPLTVEEEITQSVDSYDIFTEHGSRDIETILNNTITAAKAQGSSFNDATIEAKALAGLKNTLLTKIIQGGDEGAVVAEFNDMLENGEIMLGDKPLFNTVRGKQLYRDLDNAIIARQRQIDQGKDDEESTGVKIAAGYRKRISNLLREPESMTTAQKIAAKREMDEVFREAQDAFDAGEIDKTQLGSVETRVRRVKEMSEGGMNITSFDPSFLPKVNTANQLSTDTFASPEKWLSAVSQAIQHPTNTFKKYVQDITGTEREFLEPEIKNLYAETFTETNFKFREFVKNLYDENELDAESPLPNEVITREELKQRYEEIYAEEALKSYEKAAERLHQRINKFKEQAATTTDIPEGVAGKTKEQVKADKRKELAEKTALKENGKLRMDDGWLESEETYAKKAMEVISNPEALKVATENNTPEEMTQFTQVAQHKYLKNLDMSQTNNPAEFNKVATDLYAFTKKFGMPMGVIRNGFFVQHKEVDKRALDEYPQYFAGHPMEMFLNTNNRLATLEYATNGVYSPNAINQASKGNREGLEEIYGLVFKTEAQKNAVPLEKFIQLQIARGQKQGLAEATPSE